MVECRLTVLASARIALKVTREGRFVAGPEGIPEAAKVLEHSEEGAPEAIELLFLLRPKTKLPSDAELMSPTKQWKLDDYHASPEAIEALEQYARENGLTVLETDAKKLYMRVEGSRSRVNQALEIRLVDCELEGRQALAHEQALTLPSELEEYVTSVLGTNSTGQLRHAGLPPMDPMGEGLAELRAGELPLVSYRVDALMKHYQYPTQYTGKDKCIGLIEVAGTIPSMDPIDNYFKAVKIKKPDIWFWKEPYGDTSPCFSTGAIAQGVEIVGNIVPEAKIAVYNFMADCCPSILQWFLTLAEAVHDDERRPSVLINTWVVPEDSIRGHLRGFETLFCIAAMRRITICSASGNTGSLNVSQGALVPSVNYPASSAYVVGVGGTSLRKLETALNLFAYAFVYGGLITTVASGGGVSALVRRPGYQEGAKVPTRYSFAWTADNSVEQIASYVGRGVPDVAINGDLLTGVEVIMTGDAWVVSAGTGVSVALWGGLLLQLSQAAGDRGLGWANPRFYDLQLSQKAGVFTPITEGSNGGYQASPHRDWSAVCGLGVPNGTKLAKAIAQKQD